MKYKGIELEEITEPQLFNPPKPMLVWDSDGDTVELNVCAIVNRDGFRVITERSAWRHCAEIPKPKPELVTHCELAQWLAQANGVMRFTSKSTACYSYLTFQLDKTDLLVDELILVRKWEDAEWHAPTIEYLGLEDK